MAKDGAGPFPSTGGEDQDRLLDEASAVVKEQAFYMKRAIEGDQLRDALKHASNMICELRTSLLSPKNYYELYMRVFQEMQQLSAFFDDKSRHGRKMLDLYESVQHAGNILPRLYLLATVASSYIKSKESPAKEILKDVSELCKGVQHPIRGLFLRYYLSQMVKDKLPDTGSEYEGEGGDVNDAFDFIFTNFSESNRLWARMQGQGPVRDRARRERERHDLRVLVGANLVRLSQLEGMTIDYYEKTALPSILEHITTVKDAMSQQYLFESLIQVFPDEYHIRTLDQMLGSYAKAGPSVDMKPIMVALMSRLSAFVNNSDDPKALIEGMDLFSLFRAHLQHILERIFKEPEAPPTGTVAPGASAARAQEDKGAVDITGPLEVQAAFLQFTVTLYPEKVHYVDMILGSTIELLQKFLSRVGSTEKAPARIQGTAAEKVVDLLSAPLKSLGLVVLEMQHYTALMSLLNWQTRKQVAVSMVNSVLEENRMLTSVEAVNGLFTFISTLIKDEDDTPQDEGPDRPSFASEQRQVCRLVHQIQSEDTDVEFQMISAMRSFFGEGGPSRLVYTLPPTTIAACGLIPKILRRVLEGAQVSVSVKKAFQFVHKTISILAQTKQESSLPLWLLAAGVADKADHLAATEGGQPPGSLEPICFEFVTQALIVFEEAISDSNQQFQALTSLVGCITQLGCLDPENLDTASQKVTQHAARLLKKPLQCRAVATCSNLYWSKGKRDGKRVLECLQKCLKIVDGVVEADSKQVGLWVEMLDKYLYYYEAGNEEVTPVMIQTLLNLCNEHIDFAEKDAKSEADGKAARAHFKSITRYVKTQAATAADAGRYATLLEAGG